MAVGNRAGQQHWHVWLMKERGGSHNHVQVSNSLQKLPWLFELQVPEFPMPEMQQELGQMKSFHRYSFRQCLNSFVVLFKSSDWNSNHTFYRMDSIEY